ncbi:MAG: ATPase, T2SS/T4P/T4SS family, partial [Paraclostridium sp.]
TGHLVISTMHTNNSIESINRLIDMGIPKYLISSALRGIISQKLINKLCSYCSYEEDFNVANIYKLPIENISKVKVGKGCIECSNTGHKERVGLYEIIEVNKAIKKAISLNEYTEDIYSIAKDNNMITFLDSAEYLLRQNKITIQDYINIMEINN